MLLIVQEVRPPPLLQAVTVKNAAINQDGSRRWERRHSSPVVPKHVRETAKQRERERERERAPRVVGSRDVKGTSGSKEKNKRVFFHMTMTCLH